MKKVDSAIKDPGHGDGWFKIYENGHDDKTDEWCTEKLIKASGLLSINLPTDLAGGYYLVRPELLSLHQAFADDNNPTSQPQFYTGCAQIFLDSDATGTPTETVKIPGYVKPEDPAATFNIYYNQKFPYPQLGPPVVNISTSNSRVRVKSRAPLGPQTEGLKPQDCVDENGNWCGIELNPYDSMDGCLAAGKQCWEQLDPCYEGAPPTGYKGCSVWEEKCQEMTDKCNSGNFNGPTTPGKILTPAPHKYDLSKAMGMPRVKAVVPDAKPSQVASSSPVPSSSAVASTSVDAPVSVVSVSSKPAGKPSATAAAPSSVVQVLPGVAPSKTAPVPAATTAPSYPGSVNGGPKELEPDTEEPVNEEEYDIVYVTETVTVNVAASATAETPCPSDAVKAKAKRQTFQFKPAAEVSSESPATPPGNSFQFIPEAAAPVEPILPPVAPVFNFKESTNNGNSISAETRPIVPTLDGSCGLVSGYRCEYDSIIGTIPGCCSKFGYCGYTPEHCGPGCQIGYGRCDSSPMLLAKRYSSHLAARANFNPPAPFAATVTITPICSATPGPRDAFIDDKAEHRAHAAIFFASGEEGRTLTVDAPTCTEATLRGVAGHWHRHLYVPDRGFA